MTGANPSTAAGLERLYKPHVQRYAHICTHHLIQFHTLAFDTLGRAHKSTVGDIAHLFTKRDKRVDPTCWPRARSFGSLPTACTVHRRHACSARAACTHTTTQGAALAAALRVDSSLSHTQILHTRLALASSRTVIAPLAAAAHARYATFRLRLPALQSRP